MTDNGHGLLENYLDSFGPAAEKIEDDLVEMIEEVRSFDNMDYCGWPAIYGTSSVLFRKPFDSVANDATVNVSEAWEELWQAQLSGALQVQFRIEGGSWRNMYFDADRSNNGINAFYHAGYFNYAEPPWVSINNVYSSNNNLSKSIQIWNDDYYPPNIYQYRFVVNNKVVEQFSLLQFAGLWSQIKTSLPIAETLLPGSKPIVPLR